MSKYITDSQALLSSVPFSVLRDEDKDKLARAIAPELVKIIGNAAIFPRIEEMSEAVLDILAYDLKVDWYEYSAPIENKRCAIKEAMFVHRYKGTKYAVETALHSVFTDAKVEEWFEYGGEPFHFKLTVYGSSSGNDLKGLIARIQYAKNLRSVMDNVLFVITPEKPLMAFVSAKCIAKRKRIGVTLHSKDDSVFRANAGINFGVKSVGYGKRIGVAFQSTDDSVCTAQACVFSGTQKSAAIKRIRAELIYKEAQQ